MKTSCIAVVAAALAAIVLQPVDGVAIPTDIASAPSAEQKIVKIRRYTPLQRQKLQDMRYTQSGLAGEIHLPSSVSSSSPQTPTPHSSSNDSVSTSSVNKTARIVNGRTAVNRDAPFVVRLNAGPYTCTAQLITNDTVLTAGHCVTSENNRLYSPEEFDVRLGALTTEDGASVPVRKVIRHEGYDPDMLTNDIALLVLDTPANITSLIAPIRIYTGRVIERQNVTAFGWGKTENGTAATRLMTTRLVVGNTPSCQQVDPSYDGPNGNWTCVEYSLSKTAVCNGDSGGPMVRSVRFGGSGPKRYALIGTTSHGTTDACDAQNARDFFVHTARYVNWIAKSINVTAASISTRE